MLQYTTAFNSCLGSCGTPLFLSLLMPIYTLDYCDCRVSCLHVRHTYKRDLITSVSPLTKSDPGKPTHHPCVSDLSHSRACPAGDHTNLNQQGGLICLYMHFASRFTKRISAQVLEWFQSDCADENTASSGGKPSNQVNA